MNSMNCSLAALPVTTWKPSPARARIVSRSSGETSKIMSAVPFSRSAMRVPASGTGRKITVGTSGVPLYVSTPQYDGLRASVV